MAKITSKNAVVIVGGYVLSPYGTSYTVNGPSVEALDVTGFGEGSQNFIPGRNTGDLVLNLYWDSAVGSVDDALKTLGTKAVTVIPEGYVLGNDALSIYGMQENFPTKGDTKSPITVESVKFDALGSGAQGVMEGVMLQHGTITLTTTGSNVRDWGAADLTTQCAGVLHVWTATSTDTYSVRVEHSTDGSTAWTTLLTFTANGTAKTSEIQYVASGALKQYRRIVATRTGAAANPFGFSVFFWRL